MAEGTHTSEAVYGLGRPIGRGPRLWCGNVQITDGETLDTGLDTIEGIGHMKGSAPASEFITAETVSGGIITIGAGKYTTVGAAPAADVDAYIIVVGTVR